MDEDLSGKSHEELIAEAKRLRQGIRAHRDSTGQELCWHHPALWGLLPERSDPLPAVPAWPEFLRGCIRYRQSLDQQLPAARRAPAATYSELFPILLTSDVARALAFYRDLLGAVVSFEYPGPDGAPAYVGLELGSSHLGIGRGADPAGGPLPRPMSLWVYAEDCDAAIATLRAAGTPITAEPADQPWGERVARVLDPDGNEVIVGQRAAG